MYLTYLFCLGTNLFLDIFNTPGELLVYKIDIYINYIEFKYGVYMDMHSVCMVLNNAKYLPDYHCNTFSYSDLHEYKIIR